MVPIWYYLLLSLPHLINGQIFYDSSESINGTIDLWLDFRLYFLKQVNELSLSMTVKGTLTMYWNDPEAWNFARAIKPSRSAYSESISVPNDLIWKPFIVVFNSADDYENTVDRNGAANPIDISRAGVVQWWATGYWTVACNFNYEKFPFDTQICSLKLLNFLSAKYYRTSKWTFSIPKQEDLVSPTMVWQFVSSSYSNLNWTWDNNGEIDYSSLVRFDIEFKRKWYPYYFYAIMVPLFCLTGLQLAAFALPKDSPDRSIYSITCLLSFAVMRAEIQNNIPKTAENILVIILINLSIVGSSLVTFYSAVFVANCDGKNTDRKNWSIFFYKYRNLIDNIISIIFIFFYILLYCIILIKMVEN